ncbi:DNA repair protein RadC [Bordetella petrii]|uniref:DNA repair protein n=1 Tax=Bordetella petrii (strain ATCC BAA-461 / DSM 12804 / CCUG 43448 / CIP 107267 / Se-1111R) TaxID=340100 RepID=A9IEU5_BORPD|nr:JAB domain-containing protein [Bordetella petrii]MBO1112127.1 DNA repair protein RadC [Bordetella petrii]MBO9353186.1 DNA repair protein RadC [Bordetella petrii]CAP44907.1 putative DNA repair protein [Bordetella petrii]
MQQYSLFVDSPINPSNTLLVREADGAMRPAQRAEILAVARELVSIDTLHGEDLSNPDKAKAFLQLRLAGLEHEVCALMLLDVQLRLITYLEPFRGTLSQAPVYPREILKLALRHNAAGLMMAHNHPSGLAEASQADRQLTQAVQQALALIDVRLLDHFIVAGTTVVSMAQRGQL